MRLMASVPAFWIEGLGFNKVGCKFGEFARSIFRYLCSWLQRCESVNIGCVCGGVWRHDEKKVASCRSHLCLPYGGCGYRYLG